MNVLESESLTIPEYSMGPRPGAQTCTSPADDDAALTSLGPSNEIPRMRPSARLRTVLRPWPGACPGRRMGRVAFCDSSIGTPPSSRIVEAQQSWDLNIEEALSERLGM